MKKCLYCDIIFLFFIILVLIEQLSRLVIHLFIHFTPEEKTFDYIMDKFASLLILTAILACTCKLLHSFVRF